jgi:hypothetical protein
MSTELSTTDLLSSMEEILEVDVTARHSYFQLKYFVIGKEPTHQARLWQCLRELKTRKDSLKAINWEIEDAEDNLELLDIDIAEKENSQKNRENSIAYEKNKPDRKMEINLRKLNRKRLAQQENLTQLQERRKWIEEEARFFLESYQNLLKLEPLKHFDDLESQKDYWGKKLADQIQLKLLLQSPLDTELAKTVLALPDDMPIKQDMVRRLENVQSELVKMKEEYKKKLLEQKSRGIDGTK